MASLTLALPLTPKTLSPSSSKNKLQKPSNIAKPKHSSRRHSISCKASDDDGGESPQSPLSKLDRRNVLLGLGGLYGVSGLASEPFAIADPLQAPDIATCKAHPDGLPKGVDVKCCPPYDDPNPIDYVVPYPTKLRVRPAAHMADRDYIAKYERAIALMKALPDSDPRSFSQQAKVHCAYCNGGYDQVNFPGVDIQVHASWIFFPFHRWYLYFFERILGKLVGDPNFAIPFWNFDAPDGMTMPAMFTNPKSPLYDSKRSVKNQPPYIVDLDYNSTIPDVKPKNEQILQNLTIMHRQMVSGAKKPFLFFGGEYRAGTPSDTTPSDIGSPGTIESTHNIVHELCGHEVDDEHPNGENLGNFYSAGWDPMFYCLHGNVDRLWSVWKTLGGDRKDLTDPDWLNASYLFYDEEARLVKVYNKDCLSNRSLGYIYDPVPIDWLYKKPKPKKNKIVKMLKNLGVAKASTTTRLALTDFPYTLLDSPVSVVVPRPKKSRSKEEKEKEEEVLVVGGLDFNPQSRLKFDVYINDEDEGAGTISPGMSEFVGSFTNVPHAAKPDSVGHKLALRLAITDALDDIGADDDDNVVVTLVPKTGDPVTVDGLKIVLLS